MKNKQISVPFNSTGLENATGKIDYSFTNDYMFRAILQKNKRVLKALICALLHLHPTDVKSIEITNPIKLGESITDKDFILDIHVSMNNNTLINLEMQVGNQLNWTDRSLSYLCRTFDQLESGEDYRETKSAIHIGFLDFTPFEKAPEFYATYKLLNVKNHYLYSDKFTLSVVDLNKIELATEEDKAWEIDIWAKLFKATTWEEIKMIAKKNKELQEATETLYNMNSDDIVRQQCRAREDYYRLQNAINRRMEELTFENQELTSEREELVSENKALITKVEFLQKLLKENGISYPASDGQK